HFPPCLPAPLETRGVEYQTDGRVVNGRERLLLWHESAFFPPRERNRLRWRLRLSVRPFSVFPLQIFQGGNLPGIVFDTSLDGGIDQVLALALLFGLEGKRQIRVGSVSVSRNNLNTAAFLDLVCRFYRGDASGDSPGRNALPVGMFADGPPNGAVNPMLQGALAKTAYRRDITKLNDTADPVALIRNALSAYPDGTAAIILAGPPVNLLNLIALTDGRHWVEKKTRLLTIAA